MCPLDYKLRVAIPLDGKHDLVILNERLFDPLDQFKEVMLVRRGKGRHFLCSL